MTNPTGKTNEVLHGKAWKFSGLLDVDWEICYYGLMHPLRGERDDVIAEKLGPHCMEKVDPTFAKKVQQGDFIVAEENMGYGHDHFHACSAILGAGVGAVICESSAPYFLRNSIEHGLPVIEIPGVFAAVEQGDALELNYREGRLKNQRSGAELAFTPYPAFILEILDAGGIYPKLKTMAAAGALG